MPGQSDSTSASNGQLNAQLSNQLRSLLEESKQERASRPMLTAFTLKLPVKTRRMLGAVADKHNVTMTSAVLVALQTVLPLLDASSNELHAGQSSTGERGSRSEL
jgi:hypothetical protein